MTNSYFTNRRLQTLCLFSALIISLVLCGCRAEQGLERSRPESNVQAQPPLQEAAPTTASEALAALQRGNERFAAGTPSHPDNSVARRKELAGSQHPFATILSCSDSRVPTELLFDQGLGDLFVIRVAGNIAARGETASVEYAVEHLHTPLVLVLGHESCGAVTAALASGADRGNEAKEIQAPLDFIEPSLKGIDPRLPTAERVSKGVEANVRATVAKLINTSDLKEKIAGGKVKIVGGVYDLETGKIRLLDL